MSDLERLLRESLADEAGRAPAATLLVDEVRASLGRPRHPSRHVLAAAVGGLMAAAVAAAVVAGQRPAPVSPARSGGATTQMLQGSSAALHPTTTAQAPSVTTTIWGTSGAAVTSQVITGPASTDPVTVTVTGAP
jgi:hypothetical protein